MHMGICRGRMILGSAALALSVMGCAPMNSEVSPKTSPRWAAAQLDVHLRLSHQHLTAGDLERARAALAAYEHSGQNRVQIALTRLDVEQGDYTAALERLNFVSGPEAVSAAFFHLRGVAYEGLNQSALAAAAFAQSYAIAPELATLVAWIDGLVMAGRDDEAEATLTAERSRFPGESELTLLAARIHARNGDYPAVIRELRSGLQAGLQTDETHRRLAEAYAATGRYREAAQIWQSLTDQTIDPDERHEMESRLAEWYVSAGDSKAARRVYSSLAARRPRDVAAQFGLAVASLSHGDAAGALRAALACGALDPEAAGPRLVAAMSYRRLNDRVRAIQVLSSLAVEGHFPDVVPKLLTEWLDK